MHRNYMDEHKKTNNLIKKGQVSEIDILPEKIYRWPTGT